MARVRIVSLTLPSRASSACSAGDAWRWVTSGEVAPPAEAAFYRPAEAAESRAATA